MAFADIDRVNRILGFTTGQDPARDAKVEAQLAAVSSLITPKLRDFSEGRNVKVYYDIPVGSTVALPTPDCTVVAVRLSLGGAGAVGGEFTTDYEVTEGGDLILRASRFWPGWSQGWGSGWGGGENVGPFAAFQDYGSESGAERRWRKVEVFYIGSGLIPDAVAEGVAYLTAGYHVSGPIALGGFFQEKIGDYSYTRTSPRNQPGTTPEWYDIAMMFLTPYLKGSRVSVT